MIEDEDNEKFGCYINTEIEEYFYDYVETDNQSFVFNLQSQNNRLPRPMKFDIIDTEKGGYKLFDQSHRWYLIYLNEIILYKQNQKQLCYCQQRNVFDYQGIENALCGKTKHSKDQCEYFIPKRILIIQMK